MCRESPGLFAAVEWTVKWMLVLVVGLGSPGGPGIAPPMSPTVILPRGVTAQLIVVGLAGDDEHAARFRQTAETWRRWLTDSLQFPGDGVTVLFGERGETALEAGPASRQAITEAVAASRRHACPRWPALGVLPGACELEGRARLLPSARPRPAR